MATLKAYGRDLTPNEVWYWLQSGKETKRRYNQTLRAKSLNAANKRKQWECRTWQTLICSISAGSSPLQVLRLLRRSMTADALASLTSAMQHEHLEAATAAVESNETELKETRAEIATLEKQVPKCTFNDLIKQQCAETQRRRAGL